MTLPLSGASTSAQTLPPSRLGLSLAARLPLTDVPTVVVALSSTASGWLSADAASTVTDTCPDASELPSLTVYSKLSSPSNPAFGAKLRVPSGLSETTPSGSVTGSSTEIGSPATATIASGSPSGSLSLARTSISTVRPGSVLVESSTTSGA